MPAQIRLLNETDAAELYRLRRESLLDSPLSFLASPEDDKASSVEAARGMLTRGPASAVFGAVADQRLVGMVGLNREARAKSRHKANIWGMYVDPQWRRQKLGEQLMRAAIDHARTLGGVSCVHLSVSDSATDAKRLYESLGFLAWGLEPQAIRWQDQAVNDYHMVLFLTPRAP
jgi:ribosomal protein S18 acetylase RimI-like enzyme